MIFTMALYGASAAFAGLAVISAMLERDWEFRAFLAVLLMQAATFSAVM